MKFLNVVTDGQPAAIVAVDGATHYTFANKTAADQAGVACWARPWPASSAR